MRGFLPEPEGDNGDEGMEKLIALLLHAKRPALILGGGLLTPRIDGVMRLVDRLKIPVLQTWAALDLVPYAHPLRVGPFGVYGPRLGNFTVQNADLLLCLGSRLSQNVTGGILPAFAREAKLVMVDASAGEMDKFDGRGIDVSLRINERLDSFVPTLLKRLSSVELPGIEPWLAKIAHWRQHLPTDLPEPAKDSDGFIDAYDFVTRLSDALPGDETIFVDTGGNLTWTCNQIRVKSGQKLVSAWNYTPMGYALPAAIGAAMGDKTRRITCIIGDGGLMLCLGELATLVRHKLPITVLLFNNHGHGIQKQTLETWLDARNVGVDEPSGLAFANFPKLAEAIGLPTVTIAKTGEMEKQLREIYAMSGPVFCNVEIRPEQKLLPVLKFGAPLEDQMPSMGADAIRAEMLIPEFNPTPGAPKVAASTGV
jgi:acetolactate synthase-1/2/3 large subunit